MVPAGLPDSTDSTDSTDTEEDRTPNSTKKLGIALSILFRYFFDTFEPWMLLILSASFGIFGLWPNYPIYPLPPAGGFSCTRLR
jgi:hypothetical protein